MARPTVDLTGKRFGRLTVVRRVENSRSGDARWECRCDCEKGTVIIVTSSNLRSGNTKSCGCLKFEKIHELKNDLTGKTFGRLKVIRRVPNHRNSNSTMYECECSCINHTRCIVGYSELVSSHTRSCGCLHKETMRRILGKWFTDTDKAIIRRFNNMHQRCYDSNSPDYKNWGGRGIYICDEWLEDPSRFVEWSKTHGFDSRLEINRIDNDGPYSPENCEWTTKERQANNKRTNRFVDINGVRHTVADWARLSGLGYDLVYHQLRCSYDLFKDTILYNMSLRSKEKNNE